jgi:hypothetical protein
MVPSRDKLPKVSEPYAYDIAGQQVLMSTLSTPIIENGTSSVCSPSTSRWRRCRSTWPR